MIRLRGFRRVVQTRRFWGWEMVMLKVSSSTSYSQFSRFHAPSNYIEIKDYGLTTETELEDEYLWTTFILKTSKTTSRAFNRSSEPQICRWHHAYCRKWRGTKKPLDESERGEWKSWLQLNILKMKNMTSGPITSWERDGETVEAVSEFIILRLQNDCRCWLQHWN